MRFPLFFLFLLTFKNAAAQDVLLDASKLLHLGDGQSRFIKNIKYSNGNKANWDDIESKGKIQYENSLSIYFSERLFINLTQQLINAQHKGGAEIYSCRLGNLCWSTGTYTNFFGSTVPTTEINYEVLQTRLTGGYKYKHISNFEFAPLITINQIELSARAGSGASSSEEKEVGYLPMIGFSAFYNITRSAKVTSRVTYFKYKKFDKYLKLMDFKINAVLSISNHVDIEIGSAFNSIKYSSNTDTTSSILNFKQENPYVAIKFSF
ncbi:hypothetical protein [Shewanella sp.]|uniref:hypothetical protein n=1 Tax=Shewanella sp. TaxID=50422 RepID=UPI004048D75F